MLKQRLYWIDWMKAIGMYFIIAGHIFPKGYDFIYVFSVPLFFLISGYLSHREENTQTFWKKIFSNLIIPCTLISILLHLEQIFAQIRLGIFNWDNVTTHIVNCFVGNMALHTDAGGIGICWFIYTLVICKIIQQFASSNKMLNLSIVAICLIFAVWYNISELHLCNAYTNVSLAYPIYAAGGGINS